MLPASCWRGSVIGYNPTSLHQCRTLPIHGFDQKQVRSPNDAADSSLAATTVGPAVSKTTSAPQTLRAQLWLTGAMMLWGMNIPFVKYLTSSFSPILLASLRMVIACMVFIAIALYTRGGLPRIERAQWGVLVVCGVLMVYLNQYLFATGIVSASVTNTALIMALGPLLSSLLAALVFRERVTRARVIGIALGMGGVAAVILQRPGSGVQEAGLGELLVMGCVLSFAAGGILVQRLARRMDSLAISWAIHMVGTVFLVLHCAFADIDVHALFPGFGAWGILLFSGIFATAIANLIWNQSIAQLGIGRTALYLNWVPLFGISFGVLFLGEPLSWWHGFGLLCVVAGTWLGSKKAA
jgi:drug/metabolite transporter (DMT)-like permease